MADERPRFDLDDLAIGLRNTFPASDDAPLALALLRLLAEGQPVSTSALARSVCRDVEAVARQLAHWPNVERDSRDDAIAFAGLSLRPTPHTFSINGRRLHAWCAWDTLFLPALLGATAAVSSACLVTGRQVELLVSPRGVENARPEDLHVCFPPLSATDVADITSSFCCQVHFLAGSAARRAWTSEHPGGYVLDVRAAHELGLRAVAPLRARTTAAVDEVMH